MYATRLVSKLVLPSSRAAAVASRGLPPAPQRIFVRRPLYHQRTSSRQPLRLFATMAPDGVERVAEKLEAPALDDRSYRVIRLKNKVEALLVHDPETDKAS